MLFENNWAKLLMLCLLLGELTVNGQAEFVPIRLRDEAQQREFAKEFLADGAPSGTTAWRGERFDRPSSFSVLVKYNAWAEEALIAEIDRVHSQSPRADDLLFRLGAALVMAGSDKAFETIRTKYRENPWYANFIKQCIYNNLYTRNSPPLDVIYRALASDDPVIRDPARTHVALIAEYSQQTPGWEELWAKALLRRYGHEPTDLEILKDPIAEEIRLANPGLSLSTIPRVRALAKRAATKR